MDLTLSKIEECQFFDVKPSQINWDFYLSKTAPTIRQFGTDICWIKRFNNFENDESRNQMVVQIFETDSLFQLFMNRDYSVQLPKNILIKALESLHFFQNSNYIFSGYQ